MGVNPPGVPTDRLAADGWRETERAVETPFDARVVSVEAHTVVYDDSDLRERVHEATGVDRQWRFFLAARLELSPETAPSEPLTRLVTKRARAGFRDRLDDRGFRQLRERDTARRQRGDVTSRVATYDAVTPTDDATLRTRARLAVWPDGTSYLLGGGGYPVAVRSGADDVAAPLADAIDADSFETELAELIAAID